MINKKKKLTTILIAAERFPDKPFGPFAGQLWLRHSGVPQALHRLHKDQVLAVVAHVEGHGRAGVAAQALQPIRRQGVVERRLRLKEKSHMRRLRGRNIALDYPQGLEGHKVEALVGVCPRHHNAFKDNGRQHQFVLEQKIARIIDIVPVDAVRREVCGCGVEVVVV